MYINTTVTLSNAESADMVTAYLKSKGFTLPPGVIDSVAFSQNVESEVEISISSTASSVASPDLSQPISRG